MSVLGDESVNRSEIVNDGLIAAERRRRRAGSGYPSLSRFLTPPLQSRFVLLNERLKKASAD